MAWHRFALSSAVLLALSGCAMFGWGGAGETTGQPAEQETFASPSTELETAWGTDIDQRRPKSPYGFSRPVVVGNLIVLGGQDSYVHILNMQGREVRRVALQAASNSGALVMSANLVVLGDAQGMLYGINPQQGSILWQLQLPSVMLGHPAKADDDMLVQTGDNSIYRISIKGEKLWSFSGTPAGLSMYLNPSPLVAGDIAYVLLSNGDVVALRSDSGDLVWRRQLLLDNEAVVLSELKSPIADPVLIGDVLIVSFYQGNVIALSASDGQQIWQRSLSLKSSPLAYQERLFAATSDGALMEFDPLSGVTLWKQKLQAGELVGPAIRQDQLFAADDNGNVFSLGLDGRVVGHLSLPGRVDRSPVAVSEGILLRNNLGGLYLIR